MTIREDYFYHYFSCFVCNGMTSTFINEQKKMTSSFIIILNIVSFVMVLSLVIEICGGMKCGEQKGKIFCLARRMRK